MLRHYAGLLNRYINIDNVYHDSLYKVFPLNEYLFDQLKDGLYSTNDYLYTITYSEQENTYGKPIVKIDFESEKVSLFFMGSDSLVNKINNNRETIGLLPIKQNDLNDKFLGNTWFDTYPFDKIKTECNNCAKCKSNGDIIQLVFAIQNAHREKYERALNVDFFILNKNKYQEFYFKNIECLLIKDVGQH